MDERYKPYLELLKTHPHLGPRPGDTEEHTLRRLKILKSIKEGIEDGSYDLLEHLSEVFNIIKAYSLVSYRH